MSNKGYTIIRWYSDDLIEVDGEINKEFSQLGGYVLCSDGTLLTVTYISDWVIVILQEGTLFDKLLRVDKDREAIDEYDLNGYTDVAVFKSGLEWVRCGSLFLLESTDENYDKKTFWPVDLQIKKLGSL